MNERKLFENPRVYISELTRDLYGLKRDTNGDYIGLFPTGFLKRHLYDYERGIIFLYIKTIYQYKNAYKVQLFIGTIDDSYLEVWSKVYYDKLEADKLKFEIVKAFNKRYKKAVPCLKELKTFFAEFNLT